MALGKTIGKLKEKICDKKLETGDIVNVVKGAPPDFIPFDHNLGGMGRWAIFVDMKASGAVVRPILPDGSTGPKIIVEKVQHIDDAISDIAIKEYKEKRRQKPRP
ncbi:hypothetical protein [Haliangium sp. UPWRP_2]|uniref:hypothetical protein n=1 Tax=Haliangium sp. UPWRP_2 TaxID=1931276 RepID=UPI0011B1CDE5|nr:hypothetical protein [Haliangium sp. UPWRP_2]